MADHDEDLADAIRELTRTIEELQDELEGSRRRPRLRPPTPRELLTFTDEVAIPAALAVLETSVRALEAFQRGLELVRTEREVRDRTSSAAAVTGDRANEIRRTTLSQLDTVLTELQRAASEGALPADEGARELLDEARDLRDDVDSRLREATRDGETGRNDGSDGAIRIDIEDGEPSEKPAESDTDDAGSNVDVDAELETLKDQYAPDEERDATGDEKDSGARADERQRTDDSDGDDDSADPNASNGSEGPSDSDASNDEDGA